MKKVLILVFFLLGFGPFFSLQAQWARVYGGSGDEHADAVHPTADGKILIVGSTSSFDSGSSHPWVLKLNSDGDVEWQKVFLKSSGESLFSLKPTSDGGYIAYTSALSGSRWIAKLDSAGGVEWQKEYQLSYSNYWISDVVQTADSGYAAAILASNSYFLDNKCIVLKINSSGTTAWKKLYQISYDRPGGCQILQTQDSGFLIAISMGYMRWSSSSLLKISSSGASEWQQSGFGFYTPFVVQTSDAGYIVGNIEHSIFWARIRLAKLTPTGNAEWERKISGELINHISALLQASDGGYIAAANIDNGSGDPLETWLLKFNSSGTLLWQKTYGGSQDEYLRSIRELSGGSLIAAGTTKTFGAGGADLFILKTTSDGSITPSCSIIGSQAATVETGPGGSPTTGPAAQDVTITEQTANIGMITLADTTAQGFVLCHANYPEISLSTTQLYFGALTGSGETSAQSFIISNSGAGTLSWSVTDDRTWISCSPTSGTGTGQISIGVNTSGLSAGAYTSTISVSAIGAINSPQTINVTLKVYTSGTSSPPFGWFDTPVDGTGGIEGSLPVTGWALDDIEVTKVDIWRDPVGNEPVHPNGYVYIGDAVFVEGARPDVEQAYPSYPFNSRAGWGYMMLTNFLPNSGSGTFRIHAIAYDKEGHSMQIGTKTITCDNAHATLPFGTIDTPSPGGTVSGNAYVNFGWALTPVPKSIPTDGSTILLWIDGLPVGHPTYNNYRVDIATLFPGYANSNGAVGYYYLDTTQYVNGVHTIAWSVVDSAGTPCGIGSRYFTVMNIGGGSAADFGIISPFNLSLQSKDKYLSSTEEMADIPTDFCSPAYVRKGYNPEALPEPIYLDANGVINIEAQEVDRIEVALRENAAGESWMERTRDREKSARTSDHKYVGYLIVGNQLRSLPIGSTLDPIHGIFAWQPGPGFVGEYNFVFIGHEGSGIKSKTNIMIRILPAYSIKK